MKKVSFYSLLLSIFAAAIFSLVACNETSDKKPEQTKLSIVTTIYPEYAWVKEILGQRADSVELTLLIKNGVDLHSYKPTAQDIAKIASANMVIQTPLPKYVTLPGTVTSVSESQSAKAES